MPWQLHCADLEAELSGHAGHWPRGRLEVEVFPHDRVLEDAMARHGHAVLPDATAQLHVVDSLVFDVGSQPREPRRVLGERLSTSHAPGSGCDQQNSSGEVRAVRCVGCGGAPWWPHACSGQHTDRHAHTHACSQAQTQSAPASGRGIRTAQWSTTSCADARASELACRPRQSCVLCTVASVSTSHRFWRPPVGKAWACAHMWRTANVLPWRSAPRVSWFHIVGGPTLASAATRLRRSTASCALSWHARPPRPTARPRRTLLQPCPTHGATAWGAAWVSGCVYVCVSV